jgi:PAS domain S-box-containing protein
MPERSLYAFLRNGPAAARIREIDWRGSSIGDIDTWSESLKAVLATLSHSSQPMLLMLGPDLLQFYNDAYIDLENSRHPEQMGQPTASFWPDVHPLLADLISDVLENGSSVQHEDRSLPMTRGGLQIETFWCYGFTPYVDAHGAIRGVLVTPVETTQRVLAARRQQALDAVSEALTRCDAAASLPQVAAQALVAFAKDTPSIRFASMEDRSLLWASLREGQCARLGGQYIVPLPLKEASDVVHYIAFGINPRLVFDDPYEQYLRQVARRVGQAADRLEAAAARSTGESERNALLLQAPFATALMLGPRLVFSLANERYCFVVGRRDLVGKTYEEAFPELVGTELPALLHRLYETGANYTSPETLVRLDREGAGALEDCHFRFTIQPVKTFDGDVYGLIAVAIEMTEEVRARQAADAMHALRRSRLQARSAQLEEIVRERTESLEKLNAAMQCANAALEKSLQFNRTVTDMIPGSIAYCDADLVCRFANERFCGWLERDRAEVDGLHVSSLFSEESLNRVRAHIDGALRGIPQRFERAYPRSDGSTLHLQIDYVPEPRTEATQRTGFYFMAVDITALKEAERDLVALNADLHRSRDQAQEANRAKSAFLANMSHEIRTPLNAILGMTHLLSREIVHTGHLDRLGKVDGAAQHLLGIISDVLDLSKIEAGKLTLEQGDFDMSELVESALEMVRGTATRKSLPLIDHTAPVSGSFRGDAIRLSQILLNLLSNAVKFTDSGSVTLHGHVVESMGNRHHLCFEVSDTGIGIDEADQARLFGSFERADTANNRQYGGTGLGLALSRQLARAMGGDAGFRSQLGVGSSFWFSVWLEEGREWADRPVAPVRGPSSHRQVMASDLEHQVRTRHEGRRVLLAEDNLVNQEVGVALLEGVGLAVVTARDGAEAIALLERSAFDLVLMDMQMPRIDGLQATRVIRARNLRVPIIAMTANALVDDRHACLEAGMDDHLTKPVLPAVLYSRLLKWLPVTNPTSS